METMQRVTISVAADADQDDCLTAAAQEWLDAHPGLDYEPADLSPRWEDDRNRETVLLDVPSDAWARDMRDRMRGERDSGALAEEIAGISMRACTPDDGCDGWVGRIDRAALPAATTKLTAAGYEVSISRDDDGVTWLWVREAESARK